MVWQDYLYVSYSTNKEDVQYTRVPLTSLVIDTSTADTSATTLISPFLPENRKIEILACANGIIKISIRDYHHDGMISIYNLNGRLLYRNKLNESEGYYDMKQHPAGTYIIHVISGSGKETLLFSNW